MLKHFRVCPGSDFTAPYALPEGGAGPSSTRRDSITGSGTIGVPEGGGTAAAAVTMSAGGSSSSAGKTLSPMVTSDAVWSASAMAAAVIPLPSDDDEDESPVLLLPQGAGCTLAQKPQGAGHAQAAKPQAPEPSCDEGGGLVSQPLLSAEGTNKAVLESLLKQRKTLPVMRESAVLWKVWMRGGEVWIKECIEGRTPLCSGRFVSLAVHEGPACTMPHALPPLRSISMGSPPESHLPPDDYHPTTFLVLPPGCHYVPNRR